MTARIKAIAVDTVRTFRAAFVSWFEHDAPTRSAALAFYTLFSLAPVLVFAVAIAGIAFGAQAVRGQVVQKFGELIGPGAARAVDRALQSAAEPAQGLIASGIGFVILLFGATVVFAQLQGSLNLVWDVAPRPGRLIVQLLRKRLLSFAMVLIIGSLLLLSVFLSIALSAFHARLEPHLPFSSTMLSLGHLLIAFLLMTLLFALIYKILPDAYVSWRSVWVGAVTTSVLFSIGRQMISAYLARSSPASTYGAAGSVVMILLWVYYSSMILLFGAEFTHAFSHRFGDSEGLPLPGARKRLEHEANPGGARSDRV